MCGRPVRFSSMHDAGVGTNAVMCPAFSAGSFPLAQMGWPAACLVDTGLRASEKAIPGAAKSRIPGLSPSRTIPDAQAPLPCLSN